MIREGLYAIKQINKTKSERSALLVGSRNSNNIFTKLCSLGMAQGPERMEQSKNRISLL